jgi:hypothetical protein
MSADRYVSFCSEYEARTFLDGVQFVNDSAIEVHGLFLIPKEAAPQLQASERFVIHLTDSDSSEDESDDLADGFDSPLTTRLRVG